jgi:amidase
MTALFNAPRIAELAASVRSGRRRAVDVLDAYAERAEAQSSLNAIVTPLWDGARARAREIDRLVPAERAKLPLAGVPLTFKDIIGVSGVATSSGSEVWADRVAISDAAAVAAARAAGALIVGKTNLPEFALGIVTENARFGRTLNPIDARRTPGGSSGGEAAAIASGMSAAGLGSDYGGSVRWPAQCTGICALRPTPGRIPATGQVPGAGGNIGTVAPPLPAPTTQQGMLQVIGPMARHVDDLRLLLDVMARPDGIDTRVPGLAVRPPASVERLRIAWTSGAAIGIIRSEVAEMVELAAKALAGVCAEVVEAPRAFAECLPAYNAIRALEPTPDHFLAFGDRISLVSQSARSRLVPMPGPDPDRLARAWGDAIEVRRRALEIFDRVDVVVLPVACGPASDLAANLDVDGVQVGGDQLMAHCRAVTLLGAPVVSLPIARSEEGLPLSLQIVAAPWHEHLALDVAAEIENLFGSYQPDDARR